MSRIWIMRIVGLLLLFVLLFVLADLQRKLVRLRDARATSTQSR